MTKNIFLFTLLTLFAFTSCKNKTKEIKEDNFEGIIFSEKEPADGNDFTPSKEQVNELEAKLTTDLKNVLAADKDTSVGTLSIKSKILKEFSYYKRRYFGSINSKSEKIISVEFIHLDVIGDKPDWKIRSWSVDGGGYMAWYIEYNLSTRTFFNWSINPAI